ncbi:MAG TPA: aminotransferase class III-fold pyridoxal phosphate-dependent enzyme [Gemmataceae bacterium]|nr:aminotransferase class III-fold pyridoxal phosphate-dependent enzyme [Gemmataceae bacterium]
MSIAVAEQTLTERYEAEFATSRKLHERAKSLFPNGVTHDLRHLEPFPVYVDRAEGAYKWDVDGHRLIDYWSGHGALLLGHGHPAVVEAVRRQVGRATHPGACHELEIEWGEWVRRQIPSAERIRFTSSGTEATLMALRLARLFTGRPRVLKFAGHFHGWHDFVIPQADPPYDGGGVPGVPAEVQGQTAVIPPNDPAAVERALAADPQIGCIILEPTGGHFGQVPIRGEFLRALRELTTKNQRLLVFDEVISGFRVSPGGAQAHYAVMPDLTTLAKILAGGLPGGCVAGRADILAGIEFRPGRPKMKHPGTFNANPLSAAAGIAALEIVATGEPCRKANDIAKQLRQRLNALFAERGVDWICYGEFSGFRFLPGYQGPRPTSDDFVPSGGALDKLDAPRNPRLTHAFRRGMLLNGVDLPGLSGMTMAAHTEADVEQTLTAVGATIDALRRGLL